MSAQPETSRIPDPKRRRVPAESLRWVCDPAWIRCGTTAEVEPGPRIPGQPQAVEALRFAAECAAPAQNALVRGFEDCGGMELALEVLRSTAPAGAPIVVEENPCVERLLGTTRLGPGALARADGGFLLVRARDLLNSPGSSQALVRTLRTGQVTAMQSPGEGPVDPPKPVPARVRMFIVGTHEACESLRSADLDIDHFFKVLADLESTIERGPEAAALYTSFLARLAKDESLLPFERSAIAALLEHGARVAATTNRVTARLWRIADLAREADFLARKSGAGATTRAEVEEAVRRTKRRGSVATQEFQQMLANGRLLVKVSGTEVGQVNGLSIIAAGPLTYGIPTRITACVGAGSGGVLDIDKAAELSGPVHAKGFHILESVLRGLLTAQAPLCFAGSVGFEQTYGHVDGDSAAAATICCLLSALTQVPMRQGLALTGSVDQLGQVQPVGGVNEKIEGFFDACRTLGLDGQQGVIVPAANVGELMLRHDVVEACASRRFGVFFAETIDHAIELLTGMEAGVANERGEYPEGSFLRLAVDRAGELAKTCRT